MPVIPVPVAPVPVTASSSVITPVPPVAPIVASPVRRASTTASTIGARTDSPGVIHRPARYSCVKDTIVVHTFAGDLPVSGG
ncbi:hypothetical protein GCM10023097_08510 [Streptomyces collinus]